MSDNTKIEWTDATWNPITGCSVVSPGCTNCYAMQLAGTRLKHHPSRAGLTQDTKAGPVWNGTVRLNEQWLGQPLQWKRPRLIFVCAHGDLFHESVPDEWIDRVFAVMALAPHHQFQVLTKRSKRMREYLSAIEAEFHGSPDNLNERFGNHCVELSNDPCAAGWFQDEVNWPLPNVWLGVSAEDQKRADERIPDLLATPAAVRFVSAEPLLGPIDFTSMARRTGEGLMRPLDGRFRTLDWIIVGGESGLGARPMSVLWAREIRDQCASAGVAFHFKQWGEWAIAGVQPSETPGRFAFGDYEFERGRMVETDHYPRQFTKFGARCVMEWVGKARAGRMLDGVEHNGMPKVQS